MKNSYTWDDMVLCKDCHYADKNPCICNARGKREIKPGKMLFSYDCGRYLRESKWERMKEAYKELKKDEKEGKLTSYSRQILEEYKKYCG